LDIVEHAILDALAMARKTLRVGKDPNNLFPLHCVTFYFINPHEKSQRIVVDFQTIFLS
jgi:hypothetical protein